MKIFRLDIVKRAESKTAMALPKPQSQAQLVGQATPVDLAKSQGIPLKVLNDKTVPLLGNNAGAPKP